MDIDIYAKKEYFVRTSLKELLLSIDDSILDVYYEVYDCFGYKSENVAILFKNNCKKEVNIKGYNLLEIAILVLVSVERER